MAKNGIPTDQFLADLDAALSQAETIEGITTQEMADKMGVAQPTARAKISRAVRLGAWEKKGDRRAKNIAGKDAAFPVYGPVKKATK